jgi:predicted signal transduction protein with EAL and GGDEF domain
VLTGVTAEQAEARAAQIVAQVSSPFQFEGRDMKVSVSVGAALLDHTWPNGGELLRRADIALYRAKAETRGHVVVFDAELDKAAQEARQLQLQLPGATSRGEMRLFFQPLVDLRSGSIVAVEALVRWASPTHGLVMPGQFIDAAVESGEIVEMGRWILVEACRAVQQWRVAARTAPELQLSVNVSARELNEPGFRAHIAQALEGSGFPPRLLQLEITEDAFLGDVEAALTRFEELRALGVRMALDDFGTGYSSLSYLQQLPLDTLKLDRAFVADLVDDARPRAVVASMVQLAASLGMDVCAEGVETEAQASILGTLGVATGQGYHFASPAPAARLESILEHAPLSAA